jgi:hypothetical protein
MLMMLKNQLDKSTISYYRIQLCSPTISKPHLWNRPKKISTTSKLKLIFSSRDSQTWSPSSNYMTKQMSISTLLVYKILELRTRLFVFGIKLVKPTHAGPELSNPDWPQMCYLRMQPRDTPSERVVATKGAPNIQQMQGEKEMPALKRWVRWFRVFGGN